MPEPLLEVRSLDAFYGDFQALFGISMAVARGEVVLVEDKLGVTMTEIIKAERN